MPALAMGRTTADVAEAGANEGCGWVSVNSSATMAISRTEMLPASFWSQDASAHSVAARLAIEHPCWDLQQGGSDRRGTKPAIGASATRAIKNPATPLCILRIFDHPHQTAVTASGWSRMKPSSSGSYSITAPSSCDAAIESSATRMPSIDSTSSLSTGSAA